MSETKRKAATDRLCRAFGPLYPPIDAPTAFELVRAITAYVDVAIAEAANEAPARPTEPVEEPTMVELGRTLFDAWSCGSEWDDVSDECRGLYMRIASKLFEFGREHARRGVADDFDKIRGHLDLDTLATQQEILQRIDELTAIEVRLYEAES